MKARILRYTRRDKAFYATQHGQTMRHESPIKYDFRDPVLNREFVDNVIKKN